MVFGSSSSGKPVQAHNERGGGAFNCSLKLRLISVELSEFNRVCISALMH
jgi:hypothetical protein